MRGVVVGCAKRQRVQNASAARRGQEHLSSVSWSRGGPSSGGLVGRTVVARCGQRPCRLRELHRFVRLRNDDAALVVSSARLRASELHILVRSVLLATRWQNSVYVLVRSALTGRIDVHVRRRLVLGTSIRVRRRCRRRVDHRLIRSVVFILVVVLAIVRRELTEVGMVVAAAAATSSRGPWLWPR